MTCNHIRNVFDDVHPYTRVFLVPTARAPWCFLLQVVGDWQFDLGPAASQRTSCGHRRPDNENTELADKHVADVIPAHAVVLYQSRVLADTTQISSGKV